MNSNGGSTASTPSASTAGNPFYRSTHALIGLFPRTNTPSHQQTLSSSSHQFPPSPSPSFSPSLSGLDHLDPETASVWRLPDADKTLFCSLRNFCRTYSGKPTRAEFLRVFKQHNENTQDPVLRRANVEQIDRRLKKFRGGNIVGTPRKSNDKYNKRPVDATLAREAAFMFQAMESRFEYLKQNPSARSDRDANTEMICDRAEEELGYNNRNNAVETSPTKKRRVSDWVDEAAVIGGGELTKSILSGCREKTSSSSSSMQHELEMIDKMSNLEKTMEMRVASIEQTVADNHAQVTDRLDRLETMISDLKCSHGDSCESFEQLREMIQGLVDQVSLKEPSFVPEF